MAVIDGLSWQLQNKWTDKKSDESIVPSVAEHVYPDGTNTMKKLTLVVSQNAHKKQGGRREVYDLATFDGL